MSDNLTDKKENVFEEAREAVAENLGLKILYEDNHIAVLLKPQMTACCPDDSKDDNLLDSFKAYLK